MSMLDQVLIAAPCPVSWDSMEGTERVRFCAGCSCNVYNISDMSKTAAESFLQENGSSRCLRLFRRQDGTIITNNCPRGLREIRRRARLAMQVVAGLLGSLFTFLPGAKAQEQTSPNTTSANQNGAAPRRHMLMGKPAMQMKVPPPSIEIAGLPAFKEDVYKNSHKSVMVTADECSNSPVFSTTEVNEKDNLADQRAFDMYVEGRKHAAAGNYFLARTCYSDALTLIDALPQSDPILKDLVSKGFLDLQKHYGISELKARPKRDSAVVKKSDDSKTR